MRWLALILLALAAPAAAEDYYCVKTTGTKGSGVSTTDIDAFGWANADCYADPMTAIALMSGGDQLWIDDGSYTESVSNDYWIEVGSGLAGSSGDPTIITARNPGEVDVSSVGGGVIVTATSYITVIGIHVTTCADAKTAFTVGGEGSDQGDASDHVLMKRCSWQMDSGLTVNSSTYVTWEDCFAYGGPLRYAFQCGTSSLLDLTEHIVYRRCLVRWDYSNVSEPLGAFGNYNCEDVHYQNCVVVDGTDYEGQDNGCFDGAKAFFNPNGGGGTYTGCMAIALSGFCGFWFETQANITVSDCVAWNLSTIAEDYTEGYDPMTLVSSADTGTLLIENCTFGLNDCAGCADPACGGAAMSPLSFDSDNTDQTMNSSIIYGMTLYTGYYAVDGDLNAGDYNLYYGNTGGRNRSGGVAANDITATDPLTAGLFYVTQIEPCSFCQTAGENGGQIGAQIKTKIGVDGTFYGDTDWNLDTGAPLWPFPYEDQIREKCAAFFMAAGAAYSGSPEMDGARGFCAPGRTLTSWLLSGGE